MVGGCVFSASPSPPTRYNYKIAREYNWNVKNKASKGYEENYFFIFREGDGVYYNELETRWGWGGQWEHPTPPPLMGALGGGGPLPWELVGCPCAVWRGEMGGVGRPLGVLEPLPPARTVCGGDSGSGGGVVVSGGGELWALGVLWSLGGVQGVCGSQEGCGEGPGVPDPTPHSPPPGCG